MSGPELLLGIRAVNPEVPLILMTAYGTVETAVQAMRTARPTISPSRSIWRSCCFAWPG